MRFICDRIYGVYILARIREMSFTISSNFSSYKVQTLKHNRDHPSTFKSSYVYEYWIWEGWYAIYDVSIYFRTFVQIKINYTYYNKIYVFLSIKLIERVNYLLRACMEEFYDLKSLFCEKEHRRQYWSRYKAEAAVCVTRK